MSKSNWQPFLTLLLMPTALLTLSTIRSAADDDTDDALKNEAQERQKRSVFFGKGRDKSDASEKSTKLHLDEVLIQRIEAIDRSCGLTDVQKKKLALAGHGAIKRLFDQIEEHKRTMTENMDEVMVIRFLHDRPEAGVLRSQLRSGPFGDDSFFAKSLQNVLTPEQASMQSMLPKRAANSNRPITVANARDLVRTAKLNKDVHQIVWNRDGKHVAMFEFNKQVEVYLPPQEQPVRVLGKQVMGFDFCPGGNLIAISGKSKNATMINLIDESEISLETGQPQPSVKFSPDGKSIATGGYGKTAKLWSIATGELVREFDVGPSDGGLTPVFSPDGAVLAVGHRNSTTRLFDVATGALLHTLNVAMSQGLSFDPTGKTLAVAYVDGHLALWDVQTGLKGNSVQAWADELYAVNWTPDGTVLVTAGNRSQVTLWNASDLSILREVESPEWVISAGFSPDGTKLIFAGGGRLPNSERTVETWAVP